MARLVKKVERPEGHGPIPYTERHLLFALSPTSTDVATTLAAMPGYSDAQLWAVAYQCLAWLQAQRLRELSAKK